MNSNDLAQNSLLHIRQFCCLLFTSILSAIKSVSPLICVYSKILFTISLKMTQNGMIKLAVYNIQKEFRIYHVGVLVNDREFHYGMRIGVFNCEPMNERKTFHVKYWRKMIRWNIEFMRYVEMLKDFPLQTNLTMEQLVKVSCELGEKKYTRHNYHLLNNNCIDFAREFIRRIAFKQPPNGCWPQEIRQPLIILPVRLIWRIEARKELRREKKILKTGGNVGLAPIPSTTILHITTIKIQPQ